MSKSVYYFGSVSDDQIKDMPSEIKIDEQYPFEIEIFRTGKFKHPWYGDLVFDEEYLETIVRNYKAKCHPTEVSFDVGHDPDKMGAVAWMRDDVDDPLRIVERDGVNGLGEKVIMKSLIAKVYLNSQGFMLIKGRRYKYFSSEIHPDYSSYEISTKKVIDDEGNEKTVEYKMGKVGPVLLSGGLTNRPFIIGMDPMSMSHDKETGALMFAYPKTEPEIKEEKNEEIVIDNQKVEDIDPQESKGESQMKIKFSTIKLSGLSAKEKAETIKLSLPNIEEADVETAQLVLAAAEAQVQAEEALALSVMKQQALEKKEKELAESLAVKENALQKYKEQSYQKTVQLYCEDLRKKNYPEATVAYLEQKFTNMVPTSREQKFSVLNGDQTESLDVMAFAQELLETLPPQAKLHTESVTDIS